SGVHQPEHAGRRRCNRDQLDQYGRAQRRHRYSRHLQRTDGRAALRQPGGPLRSAEARIRRQHLEAAEYLRHLAHQPDQDHRAGQDPRGHRRLDRRNRQLRHPAEDPQRRAGHEVQAHYRIQHDRSPPRRRARRGRRHLRPVLFDAEGLQSRLDRQQADQRAAADRRQGSGRPRERAAPDRPHPQSRGQEGHRAHLLSGGDRPPIRDAAGHPEGDGHDHPPRVRRDAQGSEPACRSREDHARSRSGQWRGHGAAVGPRLCNAQTARAARDRARRQRGAMKGGARPRSPRSPARSCGAGGAVGAVMLLVTAGGVAAQTDFYRGKQIRMVIGSGAGGGYDVYARFLARHLPRQIPGNPTIVTQNKPAASGLAATNSGHSDAAAGRAATNWAYWEAAPRDGSVILATYNALLDDPLYGSAVARFDPLRFEAIGSIAKQQTVCATWHASPIKTIADAKQQEVTVSATGSSGDRATMPRLLNALLGTKFKVINGYGTTESMLAVERGEVDGMCGVSWSTLKVSNLDWVQNNRLNVMIQAGTRPQAGLADVPLVI